MTGDEQAERVRVCFSVVLARTRRTSDLTQTRLAARSGVSAFTISACERARIDPRLSTLFALAGGLGVPLSTIILRIEKLLRGTT